MKPEFKKWESIPRWENEEWLITEKIDGTNSCVIVTEDGDIFAQNRTRILDETRNGDNFDFCKWVNGNKEMLLNLGVGYHYGEWWGVGIQRNYGLKERRFSLFNIHHNNVPEGVYRVPLIALDGSFEAVSTYLKVYGSLAAPGYMNPEGFIIQSSAHPGIRYKFIINKR